MKLILSLLALSMCGCAISPQYLKQDKCGLLQLTNGRNLYWPKYSFVHFDVDANRFSEQEFKDTLKAAEFWEDKLHGNLTITVDYTPNPGDTKVIYVDEVDNKRMQGQTILGHYPDGTILDATIELNSALADHTDFYSLILHEMGHALGIGHTSHAKSIMYPHLSSNHVRDDYTHDLDEPIECLLDIYE